MINMKHHASSVEHSRALKRDVRLIVLLHVAERAGLTPFPIVRLHTFAYLANVLSPVWDMPVLDGKVLKRRGNPFYPSLQLNLDRLVGAGIVLISGISHVLDQENSLRLEGAYCLNHDFSDRIIERVNNFRDEHQLISFLQELAYAISALNEDDLIRATDEDATYSDPVIDNGNVIDFAEWQQVNYSANSAQYFGHFLPTGTKATKGEMLHFYVRHLQRRLHGRT